MKGVPKGRGGVKPFAAFCVGGIPLPSWFWIGYLAYNALVFALYGLDKWKARRGRWRIPEETLLWLALLGGAAGALLAIYLVRHKTKKPVFALGVPAMLIAQVGLYLWQRGLF